VLDEVIVTSQKRAENLQAVPISIQAIDEKKLLDLKVASFDDYSRYMPSVSVQSFGPGQAQLYVRGVTNGGDGLRLGSQPMVGLYLDDMPVTTIANNLDMHIYDVARVEALSGPQGTLFGASSMAGTMRIITNKPDPTKFEAGYDVSGETYTVGAAGGKIEGFANIPINDKAAIRLVGWDEHDGGYINVVQNSPQYFPTSGITRTDAPFVKKNSNSTDTTGGRLALKVNLNDTWTVSPTIIAQNQTNHGQNAYTPFAVTLTPYTATGASEPSMTLGGSGDLNISRYYAEVNRDNWTMSTLAVEGKIADFDLNYDAGYIKRHTYNVSDYSDYSLFYDVAYHYAGGTPDAPNAYADHFGNHFHDANGNLISPAQKYVSNNQFTKQSHELRISTPKHWRVHGVLGLFMERQFNETREDYAAPALAPEQTPGDCGLVTGCGWSVGGSPGTVYLDHGYRTDRDRAIFTDMTYDLTSQLALTGGIRFFHYDNTVTGFNGYNSVANAAGWSHTGEEQCTTPVIFTNPGQPCTNLDFRTTKSSATHRVNLTYKFDDDHMIYTTWSTGFRPGGLNRVSSVPSYNPDYLTNFELGTKTTWLDHRLRVNGAAFYERWTDAQFGILGPNAITIVLNAGRAAIKGLEAEVQYVPLEGLTLTSSITLLDAKLLTNACKHQSLDFSCSEDGNQILAPAGSRLPVSSKIKGNTIARYEWNVGDYRAHGQLAAVYQSDSLPTLRTSDLSVLGTQAGYAAVDVAAGISRNNWKAELYVKNAFDRRADALRYTGCAASTCTLVNVIPIQPRLVGISFGQSF
jgi:outer membrane receptor protein involved in Fe transport